MYMCVVACWLLTGCGAVVTLNVTYVLNASRRLTVLFWSVDVSLSLSFYLPFSRSLDFLLCHQQSPKLYRFRCRRLSHSVFLSVLILWCSACIIILSYSAVSHSLSR